MSTEASLHITNQSGSQECHLEKAIYLLFIDGEISTSKADGPVKIELSDGIVTVKIQDDVENATFSGHPLRKGAIYFLEDDDSLNFGDSIVKLLSSSTEVSTQESATEEAAEDEDDLDLFELHATDSSEDTEPEAPIAATAQAAPAKADSDLLNEVNELISKNDNEDKTEESFQIPTQDLLAKEEEDIEFSIGDNTPSQEVTRTSIAIQDLLKTHNKKSGNIPPPSKKNKQKLEAARKKQKQSKLKKKTQADNDLDLDGAARFKVTEKTQGKKKNKIIKIDIPTDNLVGPIVRILCTFSNLAIAFFAHRYIDLAPIKQFQDFYGNKINDLLQANQLSPLPQDVFQIAFIYISIELISRILFSVSLPLFLSGGTNYGNFLTSRIKAVIKLPLDLFSVVCPIGEIPVLFGKRSLKEVLTLSQTRYRSLFFKRVSLFIILITTIFYSYAEIFIKNERYDFFTPKYTISNYTDAKAAKLSSLSLAKGVVQSYHIDGTNQDRPYFVLLHKENNSAVEYRTINKYSIKKVFGDLKKTIPFFEFRFPFLNQYLEDTKGNNKVRDDVLTFIRTGELTNLKSKSLLLNFAPLVANEGHNFFRRLNIKADTFTTINEYYRIYKYKGDYNSIYISNDSIITFAITATDEISKKIVDQIHFEPEEDGGLKTSFDSGSTEQNHITPRLEEMTGTIHSSILKNYKALNEKKVPAGF
ncbi:MAG: hypothetical protein BM556_00560 [Bacteriovorax sp. MedPE-SWde]|nr:MAG: hypothetical protein BM556_00560 [Bacteriovorax sp. MedPE-SWde]